MFRTIPAMKMKPWIILKPFAADTWYMIVVIVVITILILSCILKLERAEDHGYSISTLITVAALCQQGNYDMTIREQRYISFFCYHDIDQVSLLSLINRQVESPSFRSRCSAC